MHAAEPQPEITRFIVANLPVSPVPTVPEIRLHRAGPASGLSRLADTNPDFATPYWAYSWGGGLALARHILDHPHIVAGRRILDLGCGSGLVGIAAMRARAHSALCVDTDPYAIAATRLNAALNGVTISTKLGDITAAPPPPVDLILAADVFYDRDLATRMTTFLDLCAAAGIPALIGDPRRAFLPLPRLRLLAAYPGPDFGDGAAHGENAVFAFEPA